MGEQCDRLDAVMVIAPHFIALVETASLARLFQDGAQGKRVRAQLPLPIRWLSILENSITAHPLSEGIAGPQSAGSPFFDILCGRAASQFLARDHNRFVTGPKSRINLIVERAGDGNTVAVIPDPDIPDFKSCVFEVYREPMCHIRETEYGNMRTGFQDPIGFFPDSRRG